jgi:hypothetical protein
MQSQAIGILYVLSDKLQLYSSTHPEILEFPLTQDIFRQKNIVDKERFKVKLANFLTTHTIFPSNLIIVLANTVSCIMLTEDMHVPPFPSSTTREIVTPDGVVHYIANQELYRIMKEVFEKRGFVIEYVMPGPAFGNDLGNQLTLTPENVALIFRQTPLLKQYNLLVRPESSVDTAKSAVDRRRDMLRLYAAANIVGVLTIIFLVAWNKTHPDPQTNRSTADEQKITLTPTPTPTGAPDN